MSRSYYVFLLIFLGMMSAFGPFVTDMYLPTLPSMSDVFRTTPSMVQLGLTTSMLGLAVGQIFFGPVSDKYGRRPVLISAMILFALSTLGCIFSASIASFNSFRFLQGLGGSGGIVLSRSVATDCYSGRQLARTLAIIGAINGIAPVTAPMIGGFVAESIGWQGIFWVLLGIGVFLLALCFPFRESLSPSLRHHGSVISLLSSFPALLRLPRFRAFVLINGLVSGILFSYISSASFIVQNNFGFSELGFSLVFAVNAIAIAVGAALALRFPSLRAALLTGIIAILVIAVLQLTATILSPRFLLYESLTFLTLLSLGLIFTSTTTLAMDEGRIAVGAASAIFGATGFLFGGIVSPLVGLSDIMLTTASIITLLAILSLTVTLSVSKK